LPERPIQTGIGDVDVKVPKIRDRSGSGIKFNSSLIPPYLKRTKSIEEILPWLYLRGISTGDFSETLQHLLGPQASGLSAATISRLKQDWEQNYTEWTLRDLSHKRYVYIWADGIYSHVRMDDRLCLLVIIGSDEHGHKDLIALTDGYRESAASWEEVLIDLTQRGLKAPPKLAVGDGALGFWKALAKQWPETTQQRCWVHKTANVMEKLPKGMQPKVKEACIISGKQKPAKRLTRHLIIVLNVLAQNILRQWIASIKIRSHYWRFTTTLRNTGCIFARPIQLNRYLRPSDFARRKLKTAEVGQRR
jgi:putative transposase